MAIWGPGIFDDDVAVNVRLAFEDTLARGCSVAEATQAVLDAPPWPLDDDEDAAVTYLALASLQLQFDALEPTIRDRALAVIVSGVPMWRHADMDRAWVVARVTALESLSRTLAHQ